MHRDHGWNNTHRVFVFEETHLGSERQKQRRRQVPRDAAENVNDGDADPASELLQVSQYCHVEHRRHQAVQQAAGTCKRQKDRNHVECATHQPKFSSKSHTCLELVLSLSESCESTAHKCCLHYLIYPFILSMESGSKAQPNWLIQVKQPPKIIPKKNHTQQRFILV